MPKYVRPSFGLIVVVVDVSGGGIQLFIYFESANKRFSSVNF